MDLLCLPKDPSFPTDKTPYICGETRWDGGSFLNYAYRKGKMGMIPPHLRNGMQESDAPYHQIVHPTPQEEQEPFYQTWFFFGLLAEFLGLNEEENGERQIDAAQSNQELDLLYSKICYVDEGRAYISGSFVLENGVLIIQRVRETKINPLARMLYLRSCLDLTWGMQQSIHCVFDESIKYSIGALAELFASATNIMITARKLESKLPPFYSSWALGYLEPGGKLEAKMLQMGWCPCEIGRIRSNLGLNTIHYLSRLKRSMLSRDHSACSARACFAFQIDAKSYATKHVPSCASTCPEIKVDLDASLAILKTTDSYPVLRFNVSKDSGLVEMVVEKHMPDIPYVALSHVWAEGLGNPRANSLPQCQIENLAKIVANLQKSAQKALDEGNEEISLRLWIDTLCCPIEEEGNRITLERMADIYDKAAHVLVLDASLSSCISNGIDPAEILLRVFHPSAWMRRLWTLQEGALAKSLYFQFADGPVQIFSKLLELWQISTTDARYMCIYVDMREDLNNLRTFTRHTNEGGFARPKVDLANLQRAIHFRTLTVPSDEPLCIATLLSLDPKPIAPEKDHQDRMVRVWEQIVKSQLEIPAQIIFLVDNPLERAGWRWAPRSLLDMGSDSHIGYGEKLTRFDTSNEAGNELNKGVHEPMGLCVTFPGWLLRAVPRVDGMPLHPWERIIKPSENYIMTRNATTKKWLRIMDLYRSMKIAGAPPEIQLEYDRVEANSLCRTIDKEECALIRSKSLTFGGRVELCLLVKINEVVGGKQLEPMDNRRLHVHGLRQVLVCELNEEEVLVAERTLELAEAVAKDDLTGDLLKISDHDSKEYMSALEKMRTHMKAVMAHALSRDPEFVQAVRNTLGSGLEDFLWVTIPKVFSHEISSVDLPEEQVWIVD